MLFRSSPLSVDRTPSLRVHCSSLAVDAIAVCSCLEQAPPLPAADRLNIGDPDARVAPGARPVLQHNAAIARTRA
jgi:hypothetical protein